MANILLPAPPITGPWYIDREDCIGDSLTFINANTNFFASRVNTLSTLLLATSAFGQNLSGVNTPTLNLNFNSLTNTITGEVPNGSINAVKLGGDILQTGRALLTSASLSALRDVSIQTLVNSQALVWNGTTNRWENQSVATGGSPLIEGSKTDISVSSNPLGSGLANVWTINSGTVTSDKIANDTIVNADINSAAAIDGTKISPNFGSQNIVTTGNATATSFIGNLTGNASGNASNVTGTVAIANGGTGATTAAAARTNLDAAISSHVHGDITNAGAIGSTANLPIITTTSGVLTTGSFGTTVNTFCQGNDSRLSDARTPTSHSHGNITDAGAINSTANLPVITTTSGVLTTGTFGTAANTFCQGNDSRLSDTRLASNSATQLLRLGVGIAAPATTGQIQATDDIIAFASSDIRLKENIKPLEKALERVNKINGVEYDWIDEHIKKQGGEDGYFIRKHDVGVIAQEIQEILPEVVAERDNGYLAVKYEKIIPLLIEAIKELTQKVKQLESNNQHAV